MSLAPNTHITWFPVVRNRVLALALQPLLLHLGPVVIGSPHGAGGEAGLEGARQAIRRPACPTPPVGRETLARLVGRACSIDLLIENICNELAARPYEIVAVAGGWQFRTRPRQAEVLKAAFGATTTVAEITEGEMLVLASIAYHQPVTRAALSDMLGREVTRDTTGQLRLDLIASGPRSPQPGAPYTYVTTKKFLLEFGLGTLRDLPDLEALEDAGLLGQVANDAEMPPMAAAFGPLRHERGVGREVRTEDCLRAFGEKGKV